MKRTLYLFRHGESTYNEQERFTGWIDAKLTERGMHSAKTVSAKLRSRRIDLAYQSPLSRSKDTLAFVLEHHPECTQIIEDQRIIERDYGDLAGKSKSVAHFARTYALEQYRTLLRTRLIPRLRGSDREAYLEALARAHLRVIRRSYDIAPPNGESIRHVEARVYAFLADVLETMRSEKVNVAISAHGNSMRPIRRFFEKLSIDEMMGLENPYDDYFAYTIDLTRPIRGLR